MRQRPTSVTIIAVLKLFDALIFLPQVLGLLFLKPSVRQAFNRNELSGDR